MQMLHWQHGWFNDKNWHGQIAVLSHAFISLSLSLSLSLSVYSNAIFFVRANKKKLFGRFFLLEQKNFRLGELLKIICHLASCMMAGCSDDHGISTSPIVSFIFSTQSKSSYYWLFIIDCSKQMEFLSKQTSS